MGGWMGSRPGYTAHDNGGKASEGAEPPDEARDEGDDLPHPVHDIKELVCMGSAVVSEAERLGIPVGNLSSSAAGG